MAVAVRETYLKKTWNSGPHPDRNCCALRTQSCWAAGVAAQGRAAGKQGAWGELRDARSGDKKRTACMLQFQLNSHSALHGRRFNLKLAC